MKLPVLGILIAAALISGAGYGLYWNYVAGRLQTGIDDWAAQQRALGHEIAFERDPISGFPFALRTSFRAVTLTWPQLGGALSLRAETLLAEMRPWNLKNIAVRSDQPVVATLQSADRLRAPRRERLRSGTADISLHDGGQLRSLSIAALGVDLEQAGQAYAAETLAATIDLPAAPPADYHQPLFGFDVTMRALSLPPGQRAVTAAPIETAAASGSVMGPVPASADLRDALDNWAGAGGTVELESFAFAQAPLTLAGEGTVALDETLQPLGALTIRAQGLTETIALLEREGRIDARAAKTGAMMAKGLAKPDDAGLQTVSVSLTLQEGYLWLGPINLAPLPVLGW